MLKASPGGNVLRIIGVHMDTVWLILELSSTGSGTFLSVHRTSGDAILHLFRSENFPHVNVSDEVLDADGDVVSMDFTCPESGRHFRVQGAGLPDSAFED
jgi:hypothetical protein